MAVAFLLQPAFCGSMRRNVLWAKCQPSGNDLPNCRWRASCRLQSKKRRTEKKLKQNIAKNRRLCAAKNLSLRGDADSDRPAGSSPSNTASKKP